MKTPCVELVYFPGCPNVGAAREAIREALHAEGLPGDWIEWNRDEPATPDALREYGSPTVLVNGSDIMPTAGGNESCRVYKTAEGLRGAPDVAILRAAIKQAITGKGEPR